MSRNTIPLFALAAVCASALFGAGTGQATERPPQSKPNMAKSCDGCHKYEPDTLYGRFDSVAFKAKTVQMRIDDAVELVRFDEDEVKVVTAAGKAGDGDALHETKAGQELKIVYSERDGIKTAVRIVEKPPIVLSKELLATTAELDALVTRGTQKGNYLLFDSRPLSQFQESAIPTAINLPDASFDAMKDKLRASKGATIVFYCTGPTCDLSARSAAKAKKLGHAKVKVYRDGIQTWSATHYTVISPLALKQNYLDRGNPLVLIDVRPAKDAAHGFIAGAVSLPGATAAKLAGALPAKERKPPLVVYDGKDGKLAEKTARLLLQQGYPEVKVLTGGFDAWLRANYPAAVGAPATKASYAPPMRPGEIDLAEFKRDAEQLPADVVILDVRNADEVKAGMVKTAKNIPFEELKARLAQIPKDKLIVTQCTTGVRAEMAYHWLKELGFTSVKYLNATVTFNKDGSYEIASK